VELEKRNGRAATEEEAASYLGITVDELNEVFSKVNVGTISSLDDVVYEGEESSTSLSETIEDKNQKDAHDVLEKSEIKNYLIERLKELSDKEKMVITLYYYEDLTLKEIGQVMDISESRVSQIHSKAILKMRSKLATKFRDYQSII
jgi:RNA polymerase sigma factor for flagellar operon FliA